MANTDRVRGPLAIWPFPLINTVMVNGAENSVSQTTDEDSDGVGGSAISSQAEWSVQSGQTRDTVSEADESGDMESSDTMTSDDNHSLPLEGITTPDQEVDIDEGTSPQPELRETVKTFEISDLSASKPFKPEDPEDRGIDFPIRASGIIDNIVIVCQSSDFNATLELDGDKVLDNRSWSDLEVLSGDLAHVSAYERTSGEHVISISNYAFNEEADFSIRPTKEVTFDTIRVELKIDEYKSG